VARKSKKKGKNTGVIALNRRARFDYAVDDTLEAGMVLLGSEVKSLRGGRVNFKDGYVRISNGEAFLIGVHISPYAHARDGGHEPERPRKLLLHRNEIMRLQGTVREKGVTLIPLKIYLKNRRLKVLIGVARGKKSHDRREDIKAREAARDIASAMNSRRIRSG